MKPNAQMHQAVETVLDQCADLELTVSVSQIGSDFIHLKGPAGERIDVMTSGNQLSMIEQILQGLSFDFRDLEILTVGESKEIRLLTPRIALAKLLPTVYSFTNKRYGVAPGTERIRAMFSANIFRQMAWRPGPRPLAHAFLGLLDTSEGLLLAEHVVCPGNIEVRVKRYHIGSPVHRYRFTEAHPTARNGKPLERWDRFSEPVVCFDWRHPLHDENGHPLADEPLPDDYAALWLDDMRRAKELARDTFEWIESVFDEKGLKLIDICFFIDRFGRVIFGEISPDCMRVRSSASDAGEALDKDEWRSGGDAKSVLGRYERLYSTIFLPV